MEHSIFLCSSYSNADKEALWVFFFQCLEYGDNSTMIGEMNHQFYNFSEFKHMFSDPRSLADNLGILPL